MMATDCWWVPSYLHKQFLPMFPSPWALAAGDTHTLEFSTHIKGHESYDATNDIAGQKADACIGSQTLTVSSNLMTKLF